MRCPSYYRERFLDKCFPNIKLDNADEFGGTHGGGGRVNAWRHPRDRLTTNAMPPRFVLDYDRWRFPQHHGAGAPGRRWSMGRTARIMSAN